MATLTRISNQSDTFFRKDGSAFPVIWSCSPISKLGKSIGAVLEFRDVTEEKKLEKEKIKATLMTKHQEITIKEANASKQRMTQFLDYIAHELRNPLVSAFVVRCTSLYQTNNNLWP
jgi:signal transduction histidine kinase